MLFHYTKANQFSSLIYFTMKSNTVFVYMLFHLKKSITIFVYMLFHSMKATTILGNKKPQINRNRRCFLNLLFAMAHLLRASI